MHRFCFGIFITVAALPLTAWTVVAQTPVGTAFTYQGQLKQSGIPVNAPADFQFWLWDADVGGNLIAPPLSADSWPVANGLFTVRLDFGPNAFPGQARWLEIAVRSPAGSGDYTTLAPRQELTPTPNALYAEYAAFAGGVSGCITGGGTTDFLSKFTSGSTLSDSGVFESGGNVGIGTSTPAVPLTFADAEGDKISLWGQSPVSYGFGIAPYLLQIHTNSSSADVAFGYGSSASFTETMRIMGTGNVGIGTTSPSEKLDVAGNILATGKATIGPGHTNSGAYAFVAGFDNSATGLYSAVGGGRLNTAADEASTVAGGRENNASGFSSAVGGGRANNATGSYSAVAGGEMNDATANNSTVSGGHDNLASYPSSTVGGGYANSASGFYSTVPGGGSNAAGGTLSFAAGYRAKVRTAAQVGGGDTDGDEGTFVWADSTLADFESTGPNQFLIRASGGVGIGTNSPGYPLHVSTAEPTGIRAENTSGIAAWFTTSGSATAVLGRCTHTSTTSAAGSFQSDSTGGKGVLGAATAAAGVTSGVSGTSSSTSGRGVRGEASADSGTTYGGWFMSQSPAGTGVYGLANTSTGTNYGVYGATNSAAGYAGYFSGRVTVTGTLSKGGGSFKIDHPLDPKNKFLQHSFVESPDMLNIYNGNAVTDERGYATITLPEWFEPLNRDFRYQLTVLDATDSGQFVQVKVVRKIADNQFTIRSSAPRTEVSWQVTGVRQDPFANANRVQVEVEKQPHERGRYLHPAAWGLSEEMSIGRQPGHQRSQPQQAYVGGR